MHRVVVIAHRGANAHAPENSLEAFVRAAELGADMIEMDVRTTLDGVPVVMHDETVDRTTDGSGRVSAMTLKEIRTLHLGNGEAVPMLSEALEQLRGRCPVNLELKDAASAASSCRAVDGMLDGVMFSSFDRKFLADVKARIPGAGIALIADDRRSGYIAAALGVGAAAVNLSSRIASARAIGEVHRQGLAVNVWTVNRPERMRKFIKLGVEGIITDRPDLLVRERNAIAREL